MKTISLRSLSREAPNLDEDVWVTHDRRVIGTYRPVVHLADFWTDEEGNITKEVIVPQEPINKAIEPEKPKVDKTGQVRKGLGPLPGEDDKSYREFRPVPKPGKK